MAETDLNSADELIDKQEDRNLFMKILKPVFIIGFIAGINIEKSESGFDGKEKLKPSNLFQKIPEALDLINLQLLKHHTDILKVSKKKMNKIINDAIENGDGNDVIAKNITNMFGKQFMGTRSNIAARSMSTGVVNSGISEQLRRTKKKLRKWRATLDGVARDTHVATHRETHANPIGVDEPFIVGGYECDHPADTSLPAEEAINCRCRVVNADFDNLRCRHGDILFRDDQATTERLVARALRRYFRAELKLIQKRITSPNSRI